MHVQFVCRFSLRVDWGVRVCLINSLPLLPISIDLRFKIVYLFIVITYDTFSVAPKVYLPERQTYLPGLVAPGFYLPHFTFYVPRADSQCFNDEPREFTFCAKSVKGISITQVIGLKPVVISTFTWWLMRSTCIHVTVVHCVGYIG